MPHQPDPPPGTAHPTYRVLITGSRTWRQPELIRRELDLAHISTIDIGSGDIADLVVVHGANPRGADAIADQHAHRMGWTTDPHPANWVAPCRPTCKPGHRRLKATGSFCPAAGNYRNADMVHAGADLCLAFIRDHSTGATDCANRAERAGIEVVRFYDCYCHAGVAA